MLVYLNLFSTYDRRQNLEKSHHAYLLLISVICVNLVADSRAFVFWLVKLKVRSQYIENPQLTTNEQ